MSVQQRREYNPDFKRNAVQLSGERGRTIADVAENLGRQNMLALPAPSHKNLMTNRLRRTK